MAKKTQKELVKEGYQAAKEGKAVRSAHNAGTRPGRVGDGLAGRESREGKHPKGEMMAAIKRELFTQNNGLFSDEELLTYSRVETHINEQLKQRYVNNEIYIDIKEWPNRRVMLAIEAAFAEAGWTINFHSDQRDGNYVKMS